jgi:hypothetical protein
MKIRNAVTAIILSLSLSSCAIQRTKAPQIDARTTFAVNLETQVKQANDDYITFFKDVGTAHRNGGLTDGDVAALNTIGTHLKTTLEEADRLTKTYSANYDTGTASQIGGLLAQIATDFTLLYGKRATALAQVK